MAEKNAVKKTVSRVTQLVESKLSLLKDRKTFLIVVVWVVVLFAVGFASFTISRNNALAANKVAEQSISALRVNDTDKFYNLTSDEFRKSSNKEQVEKALNQWDKTLDESTDGEPQFSGKEIVIEENKDITHLLYTYDLKKEKQTDKQKKIFVRIATVQEAGQHKLYTYNIDTK